MESRQEEVVVILKIGKRYGVRRLHGGNVLVFLRRIVLVNFMDFVPKIG